MLALLALVSVWLIHQNDHGHSMSEVRTSTQIELDQKIDLLKKRLKLELKHLEVNGKLRQWSPVDESDLLLHAYQKDSLIAWNTNIVPILQFTDIHFPSNGLIHLQNGWYYTQSERYRNTTVCVSFLIKKDYAYENKDLHNHFAEAFHQGRHYDLVVDPDIEGLVDDEGNYLFSLVQSEREDHHSNVGGLLLSMLLCVAATALYIYERWLTTRSAKQLFLAAMGLLILRVFLLEAGFFEVFTSYSFVDPTVYASSFLFPTFLDFLLNVLCCVAIFGLLRIGLTKWTDSKYKSAFESIIYFGFFPFWQGINVLTESLVEDSTIPLKIDQIFQLNLYSFLTIIGLAALFHAYFLLLRQVIQSWLLKGQHIPRIAFITVLVGLCFLMFKLFSTDAQFFSGIFPLLFLCLLLSFSRREKRKNLFAQGLVLLFLFALCLATNLGVYNANKERDERALYAEQLRTDKDQLTEVQFRKILPDIQDDDYLKKFIDYDQNLFVSDFIDAIERRIFNDFWERYDMQFYLFDQEGEGRLDNLRITQWEIDDIISKAGEQSQLCEQVYFIGDEVDDYSYILKLPIVGLSGKQGIFYGTFKSKRIPEEIGFPRLLISEKAKVFETLENYSIAKYHEGRLINKYGSYAFPTLFSALDVGEEANKQFFNKGDYSHYVIKRGGKGHLVLSTEIFNWVDLLTTFSYLFCFLGVLILPFFFKKREETRTSNNLSLAMKIQLVMISLVFFSLLIYGYGSGTFVRSQYNGYTNEMITEKLNSVSLEFNSKFGKDSVLTIESSGNKMEFYLRKFARVFVTDINFYNPDGHLVATSRPRVYNVGLLSEQMNPEAMNAMKLEYESEFIHQEQIGELSYASAYLPYTSEDGNLLGYLNLQHFGQQKDFEVQIQRFFMAIVNVFMFLLATSAVVAILVSGWLTAPLRLIQMQLSKVNFGELNEPISYDREDEIGSLIKEYNLKIDELAITAQQLAKSERENAWREMAKQVAHEIKNPLTPMKLRLQHFQRVYDPQNPMSKEDLDGLVHSLVEQIDGLTRISNEFSSFAKMPTPKLDEVDLVQVLRAHIDLFGKSANVDLKLESEQPSIVTFADKDMMVRIFNNLIKNAVQATSEKENGLVTVAINESDGLIVTTISDNGKGISEEERTKIFVPYFTTKTTGTGLGLAMVKQMVEIHHGRIEFESKVGEGTTFRILFPKKTFKLITQGFP